VSYEDIVAMVDGLDEKDREMTVLETKLHLHEHDEKQRGTRPARPDPSAHRPGAVHRVREGYGASQAIKEARDVLERQIRDEKTYGRTRSTRTRSSGRSASAGCSRRRRRRSADGVRAD